jgi:hypothetical protein
LKISILEHLQCLPQEPAWPVEEHVGFVIAGFSAPALYDRHRHGLGAFSYLISNGAADPRYQGKDQAKQKDAKQDGRPDQPDRLGRRQPPAAPAQEVSRPNADGAPPQDEGARPDRDAKRLARPQAAPDAAKPADGQGPGAGRDRQQIGRQAKAGQAWQARRRGTAESRAGMQPRGLVSGTGQTRSMMGFRIGLTFR